MKHLIPVAGFLSITALGSVAANDDYAARLDALRAQVVKGVEAFDQSMAVPNPEPEVRHSRARFDRRTAKP